MMTRRQRLTRTFRGEPVDRPAVSFYEIGGQEMAVDDDEFNVHNDPSWRPPVELALSQTDLIRMVAPRWTGGSDNGLGELTAQETRREGDSVFTRTAIRAGKRTLTSVGRRDKDVQTHWVTEHLLKSVEDAEAYLQLPEPAAGVFDPSPILAEEDRLGEAGIVSIDTPDPLCWAAHLFSMEDYTIVALTEPALFHRMLERFARLLLPQCARIAEALPGRLWRIYGSEYGSEPFLPPRLYREYFVRYTGPMIESIRKHGGYARIHSHGRLRGILPMLAELEIDGLEPLEPPPQGDMTLREIKAAIGRDTVLMGNIEVSDIENLPTPQFEQKVVTALREGTAGRGRGFVLHPSSCPYGRTITPLTMANYEAMIRLTHNWAG